MKIRRHCQAAAAAVALFVVGAVALPGHAAPTAVRSATPVRLAAFTESLRVTNGRGYWLVTSAGTVFAFGSARSFGSLSGKHLKSPIIGIVPTADGGGYWLVAQDGGVFSFGDAPFEGSLGGKFLFASVVGMATNNAPAIGDGATSGSGGTSGPGGSTRCGARGLVGSTGSTG